MRKQDKDLEAKVNTMLSLDGEEDDEDFSISDVDTVGTCQTCKGPIYDTSDGNYCPHCNLIDRFDGKRFVKAGPSSVDAERNRCGGCGRLLRKRADHCSNCGAGEDHRLALAVELFEHPEDRLVVEVRIIVVHQMRIRAIEISTIDRNALAGADQDGHADGHVGHRSLQDGGRR